MKKKTILAYLFILLFYCCAEKSSPGEVHSIKIIRFDLALYEYLNKNYSEEEMLREYKPFLDLFGEKVIGIGTTDSTGFFRRLEAFFSNASLMELYKDEVALFPNLSEIEKEISFGFGMLQAEFDSINIPQLYIHVSGLNQNLIVSEDFISLSADKYLGSAYKIYQDFFYDYQRQNMTPDKIVPDYLLGFLLTNFPCHESQNVLLDRMLYEGKIRYILSLLIPSYSDAEIVGYTDKQELWCKENESEIWKNLLQQKHLYSTDPFVVRKYIEDSPFTSFLSDRSPGRTGIWMGYRIIQSYMKHKPRTTLRQLMQRTDYQEILRDAKYRPAE